MPAPVYKKQDRRGSWPARVGSLFQSWFLARVAISSQSPRETIGGCPDVGIVVMLVEARQGIRETCSGPSSCVLMDKVGRSREFRACSTFSNTVQADRVSRFIKRPGCLWSRPGPCVCQGSLLFITCSMWL